MVGYISQSSTPTIKEKPFLKVLKEKSNLEKEGMYCVYIEYYLPEGGGSNAERAIKINGTSPFSSLDTVTFYRTWKDKESIKQDINGKLDEMYELVERIENRSPSIVDECFHLFSDSYYS